MTVPTKPETAFPLPERTHTCPGMTLRDWFAGQALSGILANPMLDPSEDLTAAAYEQADAMLDARSTEQTELEPVEESFRGGGVGSGRENSRETAGANVSGPQGVSKRTNQPKGAKAPVRASERAAKGKPDLSKTIGELRNE